MLLLSSGSELEPLEHSRLAQPRTGLKTTETATDEHDFVLRLDGVAIDPLHVGIIEVFGELSGHLDVLLDAVRAQAFFALDAIALAHGIGVEAGRGPGPVVWSGA